MAASMSGRWAFAVAAAWVAVARYSCAADSVTVSLQTTVLPVCRFAASGSDAAVIAKVDHGAASLSGAITYRCTNGVAPNFAVTATLGCPACTDASSNAPLVLSDTGPMGRGMGSGRELTLLVAGPLSAPLQTALADISITVSP